MGKFEGPQGSEKSPEGEHGERVNKEFRDRLQGVGIVVEEDILEAIEGHRISAYIEEKREELDHEKRNAVNVLVHLYDELAKKEPDEDEIQSRLNQYKGLASSI